MFRTQYDKHDRIHCEHGDPVKITYTPQLDEHGHLELLATGKEDWYGYIQSHAESVDIHLILDRFARTGDESLFSRIQGVYGDFTTVPTSYMDLLNTVIKGEQYFDSLPIEVKEQFGHNFNQWLISAGTDSWIQKMSGVSGQASAAPPASGVPSTPPAVPVTPSASESAPAS